MNISSKQSSALDQEQIIQKIASNDATIGVSGFSNLKVGHRIERTILSSTIDQYNFLDVFTSVTGTLTNGSAVVTGLSSEVDFLVGQYVIYSGVPQNTTILSIDSSKQITMSQNATATGTVTLKIANLLQTLVIEYTTSSKTDINSVERTF